MVTSRGRHWFGEYETLLEDGAEQYLATLAKPKRQPRTPMERSLSQLWAKAVGIEEEAISVDGSLHTAGGDSTVG